MPAGAVRGCVARQRYCTAHHVPRYFYVDQERDCVQCGGGFTFSANEQKHWYETLRFHFDSVAIRCPTCRRRRRTQRALNAQVASAKAALRERTDDPAQLVALAEATARLHGETGRGDLDGAIAAARRAQRLWPEAVEALFWEARCQELAGRQDRARAEYDSFLQRGPLPRRLQPLRDQARRAQDVQSG
ncbi:MAG: zinc-ribbon domain containing protein [Planctomycetota bacterium]